MLWPSSSSGSYSYQDADQRGLSQLDQYFHRQVTLKTRVLSKHAGCCPCCLFSHAKEIVLQDTAKPPSSNLTLGDSRINPFITSYSQDFDSPFVTGRTLRSPLRNKNLGSVADLKEVYSSAFQRVGE